MLVLGQAELFQRVGVDDTLDQFADLALAAAMPAAQEQHHVGMGGLQTYNQEGQQQDPVLFLQVEQIAEGVEVPARFWHHLYAEASGPMETWRAIHYQGPAGRSDLHQRSVSLTEVVIDVAT